MTTLDMLFPASFLAGLGLGVYAMIRGVERHSPGTPSSDAFGREASAERVTLSLPVVAGALSLFGIVGYTLLRVVTLAPWLLVGSALGAALVGGLGSAALVARWAVPSARREPEDPRYALQGHLANVSRTIRGNSGGEITYEANGRRVTAGAQSVDGTEIIAGSDVVIDRLEGDVVFVELWSTVEQRI